MKKFKTDKKKTTRVKMAPLEGLHEGKLVDPAQEKPIQQLSLLGRDVTNQGVFLHIKRAINAGQFEGRTGHVAWKLHHPATEPWPPRQLDIQDPGAVKVHDDQVDALRYAMQTRQLEMPGPGPNQKTLTSRTGITMTVEGPARFYNWQDISHQVNRKYTWEGSWLAIPHPVFLAVLSDGSHIVLNYVDDEGKPKKMQGSHLPPGWRKVEWDVPEGRGFWGN